MIFHDRLDSTARRRPPPGPHRPPAARPPPRGTPAALRRPQGGGRRAPVAHARHERGRDDPLGLQPHERLRRAEAIGRPLGDADFIASLENSTGRVLRPGKRGPRPRQAADAEDDLLNALSP